MAHMSYQMKFWKGHEVPDKTRWFTFTNYDLTVDYEKLREKHTKVVWLGYSQETCPDTKRLHHQGFMYLRVPQASVSKLGLKRLGQMWGDKIAHIEPMWDKIEVNERYCSKEAELVCAGEKPKQGMRGDIQECVDKIADGSITADDVCMENPGFYHQYGRTLEKAEEIALRKRYRTWMTTCTWYTGPSGVGKSHKAFEGFSPETHYVKNLNDKDWWQGYTGQDVVILNEFRGQISFSEMLDLIDKWPKTVAVKCKSPVPFLAKHVIITSVKTPEEVYKHSLDSVEGANWKQWERRVKTVTL